MIILFLIFGILAVYLFIGCVFAGIIEIYFKDNIYFDDRLANILFWLVFLIGYIMFNVCSKIVKLLEFITENIIKFINHMQNF